MQIFFDFNEGFESDKNRLRFLIQSPNFRFRQEDKGGPLGVTSKTLKAFEDHNKFKGT